MLLIFSILSIFIAWIWVDYYRLIDIYEKERLVDFISMFLLGCTSVLIVFGLELYVFNNSTFYLNGEFFNDFIYCVVRIGAIEEVAKLIPFVIFYYLFKSRINEPIDYLVYISISALGFSAVENILYFNSHGAQIIDGRAILATVSHMFDSSLIAYGVIRYKFRNKKGGLLGVLLFFLFAAISHGFYDFWLIFKGVRSWGWIITILYFFITISLFATILNNSLNNSGFFTYKKDVNSKKVARRMLAYYGIVLFVQFIILTVVEDINFAFERFKWAFFFSGAIIAITVLRLSRFRLIKGRWNKLKFEFPFTIEFNKKVWFVKFRIKGAAFNESCINALYETYFTMRPLIVSESHIETDKVAFIDKKLFFENDESCYQTKVFRGGDEWNFEYVYLKLGRKGVTMHQKKYPVVELLKAKDVTALNINKLSVSDFEFKEWVALLPKIDI